MGQPIDTASVAVVFDFSAGLRELKSDIESAMRQVAASVDRAFSQIERDATAAGRDIGASFQVGGEVAEGALREVATTSKAAMATVATSADTASTAIGARLAGAAAIAKTALIGLGVAAAAGLAAIVGFGLKSAASLEQSQVAFTSLLHSATDAKNFLADLQKFAAETPFEFKDIVPASQRLLVLAQSLGQTKDAVIPLLTTIGNLVSVTGGTPESIDSVVRALGQMASKGKVSQEEILQLAEALPGFNANAAIAGSLGLSVADTLTKITAGGVDATTGINALIKGMQAFPGAAGAMAAQSQTLIGVFSTFKDTIGIALTGAFQPVIPGIKDALSTLTPIIGDAVGQLAPVLGDLLSHLLPIIGQLVKAVVPILSPIIKALGPVLDALGPALEPLGAAIGAVLEPLAPILPLLANFAVVLIELLIPILLLLATVLKPLTPILQFMADSIALVATELEKVDWAAVGHAIADAFVVAWNFLKGFFEFIADAFAKFPGAVKDAFVLAGQFVLTEIQKIVAFVQSLPGRLVSAAAGFVNTLVDAGRNLVRGLWNGISSLGGWLWQQVKDFAYRNTVGAFKTALGISSPSQVFADQVGRQITAGVGLGVEQGLPDLRSLISGIVPTGGQATGGPSALAGAGFGSNIIVNVMFSGTVPTEAEAFRTGTAAGNGVADALMRRNIALAGKVA